MAAVSVTINHRLYEGLDSAGKELMTDMGAPLPVGLPGREDTGEDAGPGSGDMSGAAGATRGVRTGWVRERG